MRGLDKSRRCGVIVERLADLSNGNFQHRFADECSRPHGIEQLVFRNKLARPPDQIVEHGESLGPEFYLLGSFPQAFVDLVQGKGSKECLFLNPHFGTQTLRKFSCKVMTYARRTDYCLLSMKDWQYKAAFVIQIRPDADMDGGPIAGRVEHVASTRAIRFHSLDELLAFITSVLKEVRNPEQR